MMLEEAIGAAGLDHYFELQCLVARKALLKLIRAKE